MRREYYVEINENNKPSLIVCKNIKDFLKTIMEEQRMTDVNHLANDIVVGEDEKCVEIYCYVIWRK